MAKLKDYSKLSVQGFLDDLAAPTASPGGGSGAALVAATSCALVEMVAGINGRRNKAKNPDLAKLAKICARLLVLMTEDVKIFKSLLKSLKKKLSAVQRDSSPCFELRGEPAVEHGGATCFDERRQHIEDGRDEITSPKTGSAPLPYSSFGRRVWKSVASW